MSLSPVAAEERAFKLPAGVELSPEQRQALKDNIREEMRKHRKETTVAAGNQHSVMATANCIEGYVQDASVEKSAPDVEITAQRGVVCDAGGCQGWQVEAKRDSETPFDIEIRLQCTQEDWLVIEQEAPE